MHMCIHILLCIDNKSPTATTATSETYCVVMIVWIDTIH